MAFLIELAKEIGLWEGLIDAGLSPALVEIGLMAFGGVVLALIPIGVVFFLVWGERKIVARMQDRIGPNSSGPWAGPYAIFQTFADTIKLLTKEDVVPAGVDRPVFNVAPILILTVAVLIWAVIPLGKGIIGADISIGIFYVLALGAGSMISLLMAGWSSNNKYALLGALRAAVQLVSYKVPQTLAVLTVVLVTGTFSLHEITVQQAQVPLIVVLPIAAGLFFVSSLAELGKSPFDLAEADPELVASYWVEYSGVKFGQFYLAEFINAFGLSVITATLFLGGWQGPGVEQWPALGTVYLLLKTLMVIFGLFWLRGTMPRLRIDQIINFNWTVMVPVALLNVCVVALAGSLIPDQVSAWRRAGWFLPPNLLMALFLAIVVTAAGRYARRRDAAHQSTQSEGEDNAP